jgi:hypothetical protein
VNVENRIIIATNIIIAQVRNLSISLIICLLFVLIACLFYYKPNIIFGRFLFYYKLHISIKIICVYVYIYHGIILFASKEHGD